MRPGYARRHGQGAEYFEHVGQHAGEVGELADVACLPGLFDDEPADAVDED